MKSQGIKLSQAREEMCDPDYLPRGRPHRRHALSDEFDRECGYAYDHNLVFVCFGPHGVREYECSNCGHYMLIDDYTCDPDIHEMLEVGALELAFQPFIGKSIDTLREMAKDHHTLDNWHKRQGHKTISKDRHDEEEVDLDA